MKLIRIEMRAMCHQGEESLQSGEALFRYSIPRLKTNMQIQGGLKKKKKKKTGSATKLMTWHSRFYS